MADIAIYGAGGFGRLVRDILLQSRQHRAIAFLDSDPARRGQIVDGLRVIGDLNRLDGMFHRIAGVIVAVGDNTARVCIAEDIRARGMALVSAIHPLASVSPSAALGEHLIIGARVHVCVHARIGDHCVLSAGSIVEHDNQLGPGVFLHPAVRLAGNVTIESGATVGIGACVIPGRRVGSGANIEPGAVVIADVPAGAAAGGVPARIRPAWSSRFVPAGPATGDRPGTAPIAQPVEPGAPH